MKRQWILGTAGIAILAAVMVIVDGRGAWAHVSAALASEAVLAPAGTLVVTNTADSGPGTLRQALLDAVSGDTITFDPAVFPPGSPVTIALTSGLTEITQGNLTIDASNAGVILDGSGIGTTPETVLLDDVSLTLDGGPNLIVNGDFDAGLGHWRPWDDHPGATRGLSGSNFHSSPYSYEWDSVAHVVDSRTVYDTTDISDPFDDSFDTDSTTWMPATGGSTVEVRFWYRYGRVGVILYALFPDNDDSIGNWWFDWEAGWTQAVISETLPADAIGVALAFDHSHSERWTNGLSVTSNNDTIRGLLIVNFPNSGIELADGAQNSTIGGDRGVGVGPMGQGNLLSGNGDCGVGIGGSGTTSNTVSGNYIGADVTGMTAIPNGGFGVAIGRGASNNTIGGDIPGEGNLISGNNSYGVAIFGSGTNHNVVSANYIGTDANGTVAIPNPRGVWISSGAQYNIIGGTTPGDRNLISGNRAPGYATGVTIVDVGTDHNTVIGNYIGTDPSGTTAVGNGGGPREGSGVTIQGGASHNTVGGDTPEERNLISGNNGVGVQILFDASHNIVSGNYIGTDVSGTAALTNIDCGVQLGHGSNYNTIGGNNASPGGACSGECNLISGNGSVGLAIQDNGTDYNVAIGNYIGTNAGGTAAIGNLADGVAFQSGASSNRVGGNTANERNLISGNGEAGVNIRGGSTSNTVSGNYIGTDVSGFHAIGNMGEGGVCVEEGVHYNIVGGDTPGERNVISGNSGHGIAIIGNDTTSNTVSGNYIGTDINGTSVLGNGRNGVEISDGASNNIVGGGTPGERNLISGNDDNGVLISGTGTTSNTVSGNYIGTDASGMTALGNTGDGVRLDIGPKYNVVGGATFGERNVISGNGRDGVEVGGVHNNQIIGNYIGTDVSGTAALGNTERGIGINGTGLGLATTLNVIEHNLISGNGANGIDLYGAATASNTVSGNLIGTNASGTAALGNNSSGIFIGGGTHHNTVGGGTSQDKNVISGNTWGVAIGDAGTANNTVAGNLIGTDTSGKVAISNDNAGVVLYGGTQRNAIGPDNIIAYNSMDGVIVHGSTSLSNTITHNSIHDNDDLGIDLDDGGNAELAAPAITYFDLVAGVAQGTACADCTVEVFSDSSDEGEVYEGATTADGAGRFTFSKSARFAGPHLTATATDADGNTSEFSAPAVPPSISHVVPNQGTNDVPNEINVYGLNFAAGISVTLGTTPPIDLATWRLSSTHLRATVPAGLPAGTYDLTVTNPDGGSDTLANAYTVFDAHVENDDLYAQSHDLWSDPPTVRQGEQVNLGLIVHRQGGKATLSNVVARFYDGDPDGGGALIGDGTIYLLSPRSSASTTRVGWSPAVAGDHAIYAHIDPDNVISETIETNNTVSTTVTVLSPARDTTPPVVTSFTINDGAETTAVPTVTLSVSAEDNVGGCGMGSMFFVELEFAQAAMQWVPVQASGWLSYTTHYTWTLVPVAGVRYMQAWAADRAGNISLYPYKDRINYLLPGDRVAMGQVKLYRQYVGTGQTLTVIVNPISGDPDLYVWPPAEGAPARVSNDSTGVDQVSIVATASGTYQIEVYGYTAAEYMISINVSGGAASPAAGQQDIQSVNADKPSRPEPLIPATNEPLGQMAVPSAPVTGDVQKIYLPLVLKGSL